MKHFYLIGNPDKPRTEEVAVKISDYLWSHGATCHRNHGRPAASDSKHKYTDADAVPAETEGVIVLGGDGTMIQAARDLANRQLPLIGINLGTLGYLTQISREEDICDMLQELLHDHYQLENRMMFRGTAYRDGELLYEDIALNEIVITRKDLLKVVKIAIDVNGEFLNRYTADGIIIATPTGSTAYNLSAGGPVVEPRARMTIITPICPHTLNARSIVLSAEDEIRIRIEGNDDRGHVAVFDGDTATELLVGDEIIVRKSEIETTLIKVRNISFLDNLRNKMSGV